MDDKLKDLRKAYIHTFALVWRVSDGRAEEVYGDIVDKLIEVAHAHGWRPRKVPDLEQRKELIQRCCKVKGWE